MKTITAGELFTIDEINRARVLSDVKDIEKEIVLPVMDRINTVTGQENNATYMSYMLQFLSQLGG